MTKQLACRDVGIDCDFVVRGETDEEFWANVRHHAAVDHGLEDIPAVIIERMRDVMSSSREPAGRRR